MLTIPLRPQGASSDDLSPGSAAAEREDEPAARPYACHPEAPGAQAPDGAFLDTSPRGPRERAMADGIGALNDADLIAILLGTGMAGRPVATVACELLTRFGGFEGLSRSGPAVLAKERGLGVVKALRLSASLEIGHRHMEQVMRSRINARHPRAVADLFVPRIGWLDYEEMWVVSLDGRNGIRSTRRVAQGGLHGCSVTARDILRVALASAAAAIVLVHNHPSNDPSPSTEDLALTTAVAAAAVVAGMPLVDHVIVTGAGGYISLRDIGALDAS
jgi:DNA repair protein RadC